MQTMLNRRKQSIENQQSDDEEEGEQLGMVRGRKLQQ